MPAPVPDLTSTRLRLDSGDRELGSTSLAIGLRKNEASRHLLSCPSPLPWTLHTQPCTRAGGQIPTEVREVISPPSQTRLGECRTRAL